MRKVWRFKHAKTSEKRSRLAVKERALRFGFLLAKGQVISSHHDEGPLTEFVVARDV
jgi:hypothetical protein